MSDTDPMSDKELKELAKELVQEHLETFEFLSIAEDEDLGDLTEEEQRRLYGFIASARIVKLKFRGDE